MRVCPARCSGGCPVRHPPFKRGPDRFVRSRARPSLRCSHAYRVEMADPMEADEGHTGVYVPLDPFVNRRMLLRLLSWKIVKSPSDNRLHNWQLGTGPVIGRAIWGEFVNLFSRCPSAFEALQHNPVQERSELRNATNDCSWITLSRQVA